MLLLENKWKTSLISFSSSAVMLFSLASLDARPRFGAAGAEEPAAPPRFLGGCEGVRLGWVFGISGISYHVGISITGRTCGFTRVLATK